MDWIACKKSGLVKEIKIDKNLISSLIKSSSKKIKTQSIIPLDDTTASSKISLTYDALRELLEAVSVSKGFKIYNHECYSAFLKEILSESSLGDKFDDFRKIRNSVNYYGKEISGDEASPILNEMYKLIDKISSYLNKF